MRKLLADVRTRGAGRRYLIQHSAGSGKSNSIAWLAYRLAFLHDDWLFVELRDSCHLVKVDTRDAPLARVGKPRRPPMRPWD